MADPLGTKSHEKVSSVERRSAEEAVMAQAPTYGRYAEIPYVDMTPEQQEGFRALM